MPEYIDITPTWAAILPMWLRIAADAYANNKTESIANFEAEMIRMAQAADRWNASNKANSEETR